LASTTWACSLPHRLQRRFEFLIVEFVERGIHVVTIVGRAFQQFEQALAQRPGQVVAERVVRGLDDRFELLRCKSLRLLIVVGEPEAA